MWTIVGVIFLCGCSHGNQEMEEALAIRNRLISSDCSFRCEITADYTDHAEVFTLNCQASQDGSMVFSVVEPESISGITGTISDQEGALTFDDAVLAFPLMADDRISPVSAPWVMVNALRCGYITACGREGEGLRLTIDDGYEDDALTLDIWLDADGYPVCAEISHQGRRVVSMQVVDFTCV